MGHINWRMVRERKEFSMKPKFVWVTGCVRVLFAGREAERTRFGWRMMRQFFDMVPERYPSRNT